MKNERCIILVDGSNMYHYMREQKLSALFEFNYEAFSQYLVRDRLLISSTYYIGKVRSNGDTKGEALRRWQQKLVAHLKNARWNVEYGHMMKSNGVFQEKGVDVHMAVDLLAGAYEDKYDTAILISSDTDLIPAIEKVKQKKKKIEYVGFAHRPSFGLMKSADLTITLRREDLLMFLPSQ